MKFFFKTNSGTFRVDATSEQDAQMKATIGSYKQDFNSRTWDTSDQQFGQYSVGRFSDGELFRRYGE